MSVLKLASENVTSFSHPQKGRSGDRGEGGGSVTSYFGARHQERAPAVHVSTRRTPSGSHHPRRDPLPRSRSFPLRGRECQALQMSGTGSSRPPQTGHHFPTVLSSPEGPLDGPRLSTPLPPLRYGGHTRPPTPILTHPPGPPPPRPRRGGGRGPPQPPAPRFAGSSLALSLEVREQAWGV